MKRSLTLHREALAALSDADLGSVAGGIPYSNDGITCGLRDCVDWVDITPLTPLTIDSRYCYTIPYC